ncbi:MAG: hypothetical protein QXD62_02295 [Candidatus Woesearchaeota archaeon]
MTYSHNRKDLESQIDENFYEQKNVFSLIVDEDVLSENYRNVLSNVMNNLRYRVSNLCGIPKEELEDFDFRDLAEIVAKTEAAQEDPELCENIRNTYFYLKNCYSAYKGYLRIILPKLEASLQDVLEYVQNTQQSRESFLKNIQVLPKAYFVLKEIRKISNFLQNHVGKLEMLSVDTQSSFEDYLKNIRKELSNKKYWKIYKKGMKYYF